MAYGDRLVAEVGAVDAVVDTVGGQALAQSACLVRDPARLVSITDAQAVLRHGGRYVFVRPDGAGLARLGELAETGALRIEVQQEFPLAAAADAHRLIQDGHVRGKLVLTV